MGLFQGLSPWNEPIVLTTRVSGKLKGLIHDICEFGFVINDLGYIKKTLSRLRINLRWTYLKTGLNISKTNTCKKIIQKNIDFRKKSLSLQ